MESERMEATQEIMDDTVDDVMAGTDDEDVRVFASLPAAVCVVPHLIFTPNRKKKKLCNPCWENWASVWRKTCRASPRAVWPLRPLHQRPRPPPRWALGRRRRHPGREAAVVAAAAATIHRLPRVAAAVAAAACRSWRRG